VSLCTGKSDYYSQNVRAGVPGSFHPGKLLGKKRKTLLGRGKRGLQKSAGRTDSGGGDVGNRNRW